MGELASPELPHDDGEGVNVALLVDLVGRAQELRGVGVHYAGSVGHGVQWDTVTEYHVVPVHRASSDNQGSKLKIIFSSFRLKLLKPVKPFETRFRETF